MGCVCVTDVINKVKDSSLIFYRLHTQADDRLREGGKGRRRKRRRKNKGGEQKNWKERKGEEDLKEEREERKRKT